MHLCLKGDNLRENEEKTDDCRNCSKSETGRLEILCCVLDTTEPGRDAVQPEDFRQSGRKIPDKQLILKDFQKVNRWLYFRHQID
jgi:hypothetical protein